MTNYTIGGCHVHFPHQAYGVQLSFMNKVIAALEGGQNALLEAPTGSGKTLSLLCSALAWQVREKQRIEEGLAAEKAAEAEASAFGDGDPIAGPDAVPRGLAGCRQPDVSTSDLQPPLAAAEATGGGGFMTDAAAQDAAVPHAWRKPPKIFYATRTHSQIAQVVKELKRSEYKPRMAVLGSRKHYCINMHATKQGSIDEACEELLKESQCPYFKNVHSFVSGPHQYRLHDIEDLKGMGRSNKACPYYTARKWAEEAEVIFAPYSYLIDPIIRRAMAVDVEGSMLIFDEAHNMEDVCREAGSIEVDLQTMVEVFGCFHKAYELNGKQEVYGPLTGCSEAVVKWMESQLLAELANCRLGADQIDGLWEAYQLAREEEEAMSQAAAGGGGDKENHRGRETAAPKESGVRVGAMALGVMSRLIQVVRMLHQVSDDGARDYRLVVQRFYEKEPSLAMGRYKSRGGTSATDADAFLPGFSFKLCLWCMNPAVAFKPVADVAHSVVLTSGTLAPLEGFSSELGTPFAITLEAPHVVDMQRQVWAGVVGAGPGGTPLNATYKNQGEPAFQDGVGRLIVDSAATIPDGLLVFLPSYVLLDKLMVRWKATGLLARLEALKAVVQEPRGGGQDALKTTMQEYYGAIQRGGGAVFFAVCRGKVSEGLDFADSNARGVIIVGIPFPHARDLKVNEKKAFNDRSQRQLNLVPGDTWYLQQAFRALNQALGRCIRHRLDWGAILMVDERFKQPRNQKMLSRWVRGALAVHTTFEAGMHSMAGFFAGIQANPPGLPPGAVMPAGKGSGQDVMVAAVAAAVAAAGPAPQQAGQRPREHQPGRGVEGAQSMWAPPTGKGTILDMYQTWQAKPPGEAQVGRQGVICGAMAGLGQWSSQVAGVAVKPEPCMQQQQQPQQQAFQPQHPQQQQQPYPQQQQPNPAVKPEPQEQLTKHPPGKAWQPGPPPQLQQPSPQQQQFQPLATGYYFRPPSAEQGAAHPGAVAQLQRVLEEQALLAGWVQRDVAECLDFLRSSGVSNAALPPGYPSLLAVAVDGIRDAFQAASEYLTAGRAVHHLAAEWRCALPRGLQAFMGAAPAAFPEGKPWDPAARTFGEQMLRGGGAHHLLAALQKAYDPHLAAIVQRGDAGAGSLPPPEQHGPGMVLDGAGPAVTPACTPHGDVQRQQQAAALTPCMEWTNQQPQQPQPQLQHGPPPVVELHRQQPQQQRGPPPQQHQQWAQQPPRQHWDQQHQHQLPHPPHLSVQQQQPCRPLQHPAQQQQQQGWGRPPKHPALTPPPQRQGWRHYPAPHQAQGQGSPVPAAAHGRAPPLQQAQQAHAPAQQGVKRGAEAGKSEQDAECRAASKKCYLWSKNSEAAARNRESRAAGAGGAAGFEALQRAAVTHTNHSSDADDFKS